MAQPHRSSRRDFLRGKAAAEVLQDVATELGEQAGEKLGAFSFSDSDRNSGYLLRFGRRAMACEFEILLNAGQYSHGPAAALAALDLIDELESQLTVYRDDSEVSQINRSAAQQEVEVEPKLFTLLARAAQIYNETGGAYDITSGPLSKTWGFYRRQGRVPSDAELTSALDSVGLKHVAFDPQRSTIRFHKPGMEINLGSIGKGYALDRVAEHLMAGGIKNFLLHGGNSSVLGRGGRGNSIELERSNDALSEPLNASGGWWIGLRHPLALDRRIGEILLRDRALGTSGSGTQYFTHEGRRYGHILDPRTGWPAEGVLSVTVVAPTGAAADALATAFYVLGVDATMEYCRRHAEVAAVVISSSAASDTVNVACCGFSEGELRLYEDPSLTPRPACE